MDELLKLLQELKDGDNAELVKVYFQDTENYSIKLIKNGTVCRRIKKGYTKQDIKESKTKKVVVNKKANRYL